MMKRLVTQIFADDGDKYFDYEEEFDALARAIEAKCAKVTEGFVLVPIEPTVEIRIAIERSAVITGSSTKAIYKAMLAAAPKPAQLNINGLTVEEQAEVDKVLDMDDAAQAKKQEPFPFSADRVTHHKTTAAIMPGNAALIEPHHELICYALKVGDWFKERNITHWKIANCASRNDLEAADKRIAALEEAAHYYNRRWQVQEAIAKLDAVFGNAGNEPTPD